MSSTIKEDVQHLVEFVGREGAIAALVKSEKHNLQSLVDAARLLNLPSGGKETKEELARRIVRSVDRRIQKSIDELKAMSKDELVSYFASSGCDKEELIELLLTVDLKSRVTSHRAAMEFAATQISSLGIFERLADPAKGRVGAASNSVDEVNDRGQGRFTTEDTSNRVSELRKANDELVALNERILGGADIPLKEWQETADDVLPALFAKLDAATAPSASTDSEKNPGMRQSYREPLASTARRLRHFVARTLNPAVDSGNITRKVVVTLGDHISDVLGRIPPLLDELVEEQRHNQ